MNSSQQAHAHLAKATEFLEAAQVSLDIQLFSAATSNAVLAGINAKDAICWKLNGRTTKADDHGAAVDELRRAGRVGAELAPSLQRLLKMKTRSQYQSTMVSASDAASAVEWAQRLVASAKVAVSSS